MDPFEIGALPVDDLHTLYYEVSGHPKGEPILFLHGGPGSSSDPKHRNYFDPNRYKIVLFDQRGAGKSTPLGATLNNDTWKLVEDIEKLRTHLEIPKWALFGGSWGSTLALTYAIMYPQFVTKMILRGIFLGTQEELHWFYQDGANRFFPKEWESFVNFLPKELRENTVKGYATLFKEDDPSAIELAAKHWAQWELTCCRLHYDKDLVEMMVASKNPQAMAKIECHYFSHDCFFPEKNWILQRVSRLTSIPVTIVQGRYDLVCPPKKAYELVKSLRKGKLYMLPEAGHASSDPGMYDTLIQAAHQD